MKKPLKKSSKTALAAKERHTQFWSPRTLLLGWHWHCEFSFGFQTTLDPESCVVAVKVILAAGLKRACAPYDQHMAAAGLQADEGGSGGSLCAPRLNTLHHLP